MARLTAQFRVQALVRRVHAAGGSAMVLARGDETAGALLIVAGDRGSQWQCFERGLDASGNPAAIVSGPADADEAAIADYWHRRRRNDPDLWVVEVDVAQAERFAAETILSG
jgi:hypothetical protein